MIQTFEKNLHTEITDSEALFMKEVKEDVKSSEARIMKKLDEKGRGWFC